MYSRLICFVKRKVENVIPLKDEALVTHFWRHSGNRKHRRGSRIGKESRRNATMLLQHRTPVVAYRNFWMSRRKDLNLSFSRRTFLKKMGLAPVLLRPAPFHGLTFE